MTSSETDKDPKATDDTAPAEDLRPMEVVGTIDPRLFAAEIKSERDMSIYVHNQLNLEKDWTLPSVPGEPISEKIKDASPTLTTYLGMPISPIKDPEYKQGDIHILPHNADAATTFIRAWNEALYDVNRLLPSDTDMRGALMDLELHPEKWIQSVNLKNILDRKQGLKVNPLKHFNYRVPTYERSEFCQLSSSVVYRGELGADGKPEGHGELYRIDNSRYKGEFRDGVVDGRGTFSTPRGTEYCGTYYKGQAMGFGRMKTRHYTYTGFWLADKKCGKGMEIRADGEIYHGDFEDNMRNGRGACQYADGSVYHGLWKDGYRWGKGAYIKMNGDSYIGQWGSDKPEGTGLYVYNGGAVRYAGEFSRGIPNGIGMMNRADGFKYYGQWAKGVPDGVGCLWAENRKYWRSILSREGVVIGFFGSSYEHSTWEEPLRGIIPTNRVPMPDIEPTSSDNDSEHNLTA